MVNIKRLYIRCFIIIFILLLVNIGCKKTEYDLENVIPEIDSIDKNEDEESLKWPDDLIGNTPIYKGSLLSVKKDGKSCSIIFSNGNRNEIDKYIKELEEKGYKGELNIDDGEIYMYCASREKEKDIITLNYIEKDNTLLISYIKE